MPVAGIRMRGCIRTASAAGFEADVVSVPGPDSAVRRIDQPALPPSVSVVEPWLVVRGSTGRPPVG
jgi:hypothetical protein